jgi:diamine N-acetyltransferase
MQYAIRPPRPEEYDTLRVFAERTFRVAYEHLNDPVQFAAYTEKHFDPAFFVAEINTPGTEFWTVWEGDTLLAYAKIWPDRPLAELQDAPALEIQRIYVAPEAQGRGLGQYLLDFCKQRAREVGAVWLYLSVWTENPRAIAFYQRNGLEIFGEMDFYVGTERQTDWWMGCRVE